MQKATHFQIYCTHSIKKKFRITVFIIFLKAVFLLPLNNVRKDVEKIINNVRRIKTNSTTEIPVSVI